MTKGALLTIAIVAMLAMSGCASGGQTAWKHVATVDSPGVIAFRDSSLGWMASKHVLVSLDGGISWSISKAPIRPSATVAGPSRPTRMSDVANPAMVGCPTKSTVWLAFQGQGWPDHEKAGTGGLLVSHDGGRVWRDSLILRGHDEQVQSVSWVGDSDGWVLYTQNANDGLHVSGAREYLLHTGDGGMTWRTARSGGGLVLSEIDFSSATEGWAFSDESGAVRTADGGATWQKTAAVHSNGGYAVVDPLHAWVVGGYAIEGQSPVGSLEFTTDGGASWHQNGQFDSTPLNGAFFADDRHGWVFGNRALYGTSDGGASCRKELTLPGDLGVEGWSFSRAGGKVMALASFGDQGELYSRSLPGVAQ